MNTANMNTTDFTKISSTLPAYTLYPRPPLFSFISDFHLSLVLPVAAYWALSFVYVLISYFDLFADRRIHTPAELLARNRATLLDVLRSILGQQLWQTCWALFLGYGVIGTQEMIGMEEYNLAVWVERVRIGSYWLQWILTIGVTALGFDLRGFKGNQGVYFPIHISITNTNGERIAWESVVAQAIYYILIPAARFGIAIFCNDSWQYFWHRAMHQNKWMYRNMHALHHKMHVPYAVGAFYNTFFEAFLMDTIGATLSLYTSGLSMRQTMIFTTVSVLKGVDDHGGYKLPWNPLQWLGEQDTVFHDIHHQSWGAGTNYSQLYTTFWDHVLGTVNGMTREEVEKHYKKGRDDAAEKIKKSE